MSVYLAELVFVNSERRQSKCSIQVPQLLNYNHWPSQAFIFISGIGRLYTLKIMIMIIGWFYPDHLLPSSGFRIPYRHGNRNTAKKHNKHIKLALFSQKYAIASALIWEPGDGSRFLMA